jgi:hypothetical protein
LSYLLTTIDKSLESQVVARAYRMGATENVYVEQLVSRNSIEELIVQMNKRNDSSQDALYANSDEIEHFQSEYYGNKANLSTEESNDKNNKNNKDNTSNSKVNAQAKVQYLLSNVKLIRPNHVKPINRKRAISQTEASSTSTTTTTTTERKKKSVKFNI